MNVDLTTAEIGYLRQLVEARNTELRGQLALATSLQSATFGGDAAKEMRLCVSSIAKLDGALRR